MSSKTYLSHQEYLFLCCVEFYVFDIFYTFAKQLIFICDKYKNGRNNKWYRQRNNKGIYKERSTCDYGGSQHKTWRRNEAQVFGINTMCNCRCHAIRLVLLSIYSQICGRFQAQNLPLNILMYVFTKCQQIIPNIFKMTFKFFLCLFDLTKLLNR